MSTTRNKALDEAIAQIADFGKAWPDTSSNHAVCCCIERLRQLKTIPTPPSLAQLDARLSRLEAKEQE